MFYFQKNQITILSIAVCAAVAAVNVVVVIIVVGCGSGLVNVWITSMCTIVGVLLVGKHPKYPMLVLTAV